MIPIRRVEWVLSPPVGGRGGHTALEEDTYPLRLSGVMKLTTTHEHTKAGAAMETQCLQNSSQDHSHLKLQQ